MAMVKFVCFSHQATAEAVAGKRERRRSCSSRIISSRSKLQAPVYDIFPLEEGAGKRCSECAAVAVVVVEE